MYNRVVFEGLEPAVIHISRAHPIFFSRSRKENALQNAGSHFSDSWRIKHENGARCSEASILRRTLFNAGTQMEIKEKSCNNLIQK